MQSIINLSQKYIYNGVLGTIWSQFFPYNICELTKHTSNRSNTYIGKNIAIKP